MGKNETSKHDPGCINKHLSSENLAKILSERIPDKPIRLENSCLHGELIKNYSLAGDILDKCNFQDTTIMNCNFNKAAMCNCNFNNAEISSTTFINADMTRSSFKAAYFRNVDFSDAILVEVDLHDAELRNVRINNTLLTRHSFGKMLRAEKEGDFFEACEIYRNLKHNFEQIGEHESVSWAYYRERVSRYRSRSLFLARYNYSLVDTNDKSTKEAWRSLVFWIKSKSWLYWLSGLLQDWLWGFAQKPWRTLIWGTAIVVLFSLFYYYFNLICFGSEACVKSEFSPTLLHCLLYSAAAFSTSSIPNIIGRNEIAYALSSFQGILGVTVLALFTASWSSKLGGVL